MADKITLPRNYKPSHYKLSLSDLDFQAWTYKGTVSIDLKITQKTNSITLNAEELKITGSELHGRNGDAPRVIPPSGCSFQSHATSVTLSFDEELLVGRAYELVIHYEGLLNTRPTGFYRAQYKASSEPPASVARDENGARYMVCTQFQPVGARRAFPCFDEPNMKAVFSLEIELPADQTAVSNMPVAATEDMAGGRKRVSFETTPVMSTYLLAWVVGDLRYIETWTAREYGSGRIPVRFYATAGLEEQGHYAMEEAAKAVDFFSETFGIDYPLAKMDLVAIPEFSFGAMENWGFIAGKTSIFLFDEKTSDPSRRRVISSVVAHEVSHQWFGNLVTMDWWDELWLNEGFATWAGHLAVDRLHPDWDVWAGLMGAGMEGALIRDAARSSRAIRADVPDAHKANDMFDPISYQKSCAVLNMLARHLGLDAFLSGVAAYLRRSSHGNATAEDLWRALGEVSGDDVVANIRPWIERVGHPLVAVTKESRRVVLRQSRFLAVDDMKPEEDETIWWVPLGFRDLSGKGDSPVSVELSEKQTSISISEDQLFLLNSSGTGFFRVEYPPQHLTSLGQNLDRLSTAEKLTLLNSASALAFSGSGSTVALLALLQAFAERGETDLQVWLRMIRDFTRLRRRFDDDNGMLAGIHALTRSVIGGMARELGWERATGEPHLRSELRRVVLEEGFLCESPEIMETARQKNAEYLADPGKLAVDPSLLYLVWGAEAQASPDEAVPSLLRQWQASTSGEHRGRLVRAMCLVRDPDVIRSHILPFGYGTPVPSDITDADTGRANAAAVLRPVEMRPLVMALATQWPARRLQWEHVKTHWDAVSARVGDAALGGLLSACLSGAVDEAEAVDVDVFFSGRDAKGRLAATLAKVNDGILSASRFRRRERGPLAAWLQEQGHGAIRKDP